MLILSNDAQFRNSTKLSNEIKRETSIQEARKRQTAAIMSLAAARLKKQKSYAKAKDLMQEAVEMYEMDVFLDIRFHTYQI